MLPNPGTSSLARGPTSCAIAVNDLHARINDTEVAEVWRPRSTDDAALAVSWAVRSRRKVAICGGRHAMGGQQFLSDHVLIDTRAMTGITALNQTRGIVTARAGTTWPELVRDLHQLQPNAPQWSIIQKQTGADRLTLGGALSANVHGRGLGLPPIIADVESFVLITEGGLPLICSRTENTELFSLAIGGYGLFGLITEVSLRLRPRHKLQRVVRIIDADALPALLADRRAGGFEYGDFQFEIDAASPGFLRRGVCSCYQPVEDDIPIPAQQRSLNASDWLRLITLAHTDKSRAFDEYQRHYVATDGQIYWSDLHQIAEYVEGYHPEIDARLGCSGGEIITELFVVPDRLPEFLLRASQVLRRREADVIYGTVRLVGTDTESALPWARAPRLGTVLNLHVDHRPDELARAASTLRELIDVAIELGGSFYLTYHRFARRDQLLHCYPELPAFLARKDALDPDHLFDSDWHQHLRHTLEQ